MNHPLGRFCKLLTLSIVLSSSLAAASHWPSSPWPRAHPNNTSNVTQALYMTLGKINRSFHKGKGEFLLASNLVDIGKTWAKQMSVPNKKLNDDLQKYEKELASEKNDKWSLGNNFMRFMIGVPLAFFSGAAITTGSIGAWEPTVPAAGGALFLTWVYYAMTTHVGQVRDKLLKQSFSDPAWADAIRELQAEGKEIHPKLLNALE